MPLYTKEMWQRNVMQIWPLYTKEMWQRNVMQICLSTPKKCANIWFPIMRFGWPEHGMSFLRAEPSKTNMHTCKDKPFCTTPTSVLLMKPMHSRSPFSAQHFWAFGGSALKMGDKRTSGLSSVDVRRFMPCELAENRSVLSARAFPELSTPWMDLFFRKKRCLKFGCLNSRTP